MNPWCQMVNVYRVLYQMLHCDWNAQETPQVTLKGVWSVWLQGGGEGHSHMPCSHNCDCGQSAVNSQNGVLAAGQQSKYPETVTFNSEN